MTVHQDANSGRDPVVEAVRADLLHRSQIGIAKYGVMLSRTDLKLRDWLQHAYEETLDQANYLKCAILEIDAQTVAAGGAAPIDWLAQMAKASAALAAMTPEARREMYRRQRESWIRGEAGMGSDADEAAYAAAVSSNDAAALERLDREAEDQEKQAVEILSLKGILR